jgi:T5SS/PEP-CTERM-associated repeat protein
VGDSVEGIQSLGLGSATIDGLGSRWSTNFLIVGERGIGEVRVTNGGLLDVGSQIGSQFQTTLGMQIGSFGRLIVSGADSRWVNSSNLVVGNQGNGELWIEDRALVNSKSVQIAAGVSAGEGLVVVRGKHTRWQTTNIVVGGGVRTSSNVRGRLEISNGAMVSLGFTGEGLNIGPAGRVTLDGGSLGDSTRQFFSNNGILEGDGTVRMASLSNRNGARIAVGAGQRLRFAGSLNNEPSARVEVMGGELEVEGTFMNAAQANVIAENATLRTTAGKGMSNSGNFRLMGANRAYGDVFNNSAGAIVVDPDSQVTFYNNVQNLNLIHASERSSVRFLAALQNKGVAGPGNVILDGAIQPGSGFGSMEFGGDVAFGPLSSLRIDIAGTTPGTQFDQLNISGTATLGGALTLTGLAQLGAPTTLTILQAGELDGTFSSVPAIGASLGSGIRFNGITYDYAQDAVRVSLLPAIEGDFNQDAMVDGNDLLEWQRQLGSNVEPGSGADANGDGLVDAADLASWRAAVTAAFAPASQPAQTAVPEPASAALALAAACCALGTRRAGLRL